MSKITDGTLVPLGLAVAVIGGGAVWLTTLHLTTAANAQRIVEVKTTVDSYEERQLKMFEAINQIKSDVSEIKVEIKYLRKK
jgi:Zn-dependent alcohol dehydrogenase